MPSDRPCGSFFSCGACLASFPYSSSKPSCKWCVLCPNGGKCIKASESCDVAHPCPCSIEYPCNPNQKNHQQQSLEISDNCVANTCEATSCAACSGLNCMWTPQLNWVSEVRRGWSLTPYAFSWNCFRSQLGQQANIVVKSPPDPCPQPCTAHTNCIACLSSKGWFSCD